LCLISGYQRKRVKSNSIYISSGKLTLINVVVRDTVNANHWIIDEVGTGPWKLCGRDRDANMCGSAWSISLTTWSSPLWWAV